MLTGQQFRVSVYNQIFIGGPGLNLEMALKKKKKKKKLTWISWRLVTEENTLYFVKSGNTHDALAYNSYNRNSDKSAPGVYV